MSLNKSKLFVLPLWTWCILCTGFILLFASCSSGPKNTFDLSGNTTGLDGSKASVIAFYTLGKQDTLGSSVVKNGKFTITGKLNSPAMVSIIFDSPKYYASFWLVPGNVEISLDTSKTVEGRRNTLEVQVTGSPENDLYEKFNENNKTVYKDLDVAYDSLKIVKNPAAKIKLEDRVDKLREDAQAAMSKKIFEFARQNNSSVVSAYLMRTQINDYYHSVDTLESILNGFTNDVKKSEYYKSIQSDLEVLKRIQPGKKAPDFTLLNPQDKEISLSSLKGKVVLIDFWASWCKPCIASIPDLKKTYKAYKNKGFEIFGVSDDSKKDAWIKSMKENDLPWLNVVDEFPKPPEPFGPARVGVLYGIHYIPATILVNREGTIVAKNLHGDELREKIKEVL